MPRLPFFRAHSRLQEQVSAYVDNELGGREQARVRDHLEACAECTALAGSFAGTKQLLAALPAVEPPRSFRLTPAIMAAPARSRPVPARSRLPLRVAQMATAVAVMALAIVVVVDLGDSGSSGSQTAAPASAGGAESAGSLASKGAPADAAAPTVATVRPFNSGGVEGQGVTSPPPAARGTAAPAQAPYESRDGATEGAPKPQSQVAAPSTSNDSAPYRWAEAALGASTIVAAAAMAALWRSRRRHSDD
jgi:hypothetical protein